MKFGGLVKLINVNINRFCLFILISFLIIRAKRYENLVITKADRSLITAVGVYSHNLLSRKVFFNMFL